MGSKFGLEFGDAGLEWGHRLRDFLHRESWSDEFGTVPVVGQDVDDEDPLHLRRVTTGRPRLFHKVRIFARIQHFGVTENLQPLAARVIHEEQRDAVVRRQAELAIGMADAVFFLVDGIAGATDLDQAIARSLRRRGAPSLLVVNKVAEGRPHIVDAIKNGQVQLVFNTTEGATALADSRPLRRAALLHKVPYYTTLSGAVAAAQGIKAYLGDDLEVRALQSYFGQPR